MSYEFDYESITLPCAYNFAIFASGKDTEILCHDGTVRDMVFLDDNRLVSGGAGDCKVYVTDCVTGKTMQSLTCHSG